VVALEHDLTPLHDDRDYEAIAAVRPLKHQRVQLAPSAQGEP
jgi:predicted nucleic acid-binding protein